MHLNEKQSQIMDFLRFDWSNRIREVSKDKTKLIPCRSMGPKNNFGPIKSFWSSMLQFFWTNPICFGRVQIILDRSKL